MTTNLPDEDEQLASFAERIRKLEKINLALMGRVERSLDMSGGAFSLFQAAILLEDKIKLRTRDLQQTLENLSDAYASLQDARDEAETAKQNLTDAIEAVSEGFALFDASEHLVMCNRQFRSALPDCAGILVPGAAFHEIAGYFAKSEHLVLDGRLSRSKWATQRLDLFRKPHASFILQASGDRWLQVSNRKTVSGATVIFQTDITDTVRAERVRHERELDEQAKLLRATLDHLPQGICMFSKSMQLRTWNTSLVTLLNLPIRLLAEGASLTRIFRRLSDSSFIFRDPHVIDKWLQNTSAGNLSAVELERSDGLILSANSQAMPDGGVVVTFTDITRERQQTLSLQEINENLEQRVEERTRELRQEVAERRAIQAQLLQAKDEAEEANKGKTRFLAAASHDLLQPLNASRIFLSLLQETELSAKQSRFVGNADRAFGSVEQLLGSLLDISRFESRSVETNITEFPLDTLFQTLVAEFQPLCERKDLTLHCVHTGLWIESDEALLRRIVQNLLANAARYTDIGKILIGARRRGNQVSIEVWDTGPGIPEDKQKLVFEEFRRLRHSDGAEPRAMGLGLAIVDRIAKLLGHGVTLRSVPDKGSCFSLEVSLAASRQSTRQLLDHGQVRRSTINVKPTVIVIENDLQILEGMIELLGTRNCHAIPTVSSEEAIEALETLNSVPNLVIADYHLDNGTGLDAVVALRRACGRNIPAIMVTANHSPELKEELASRQIAYIGKPLRPARLFDAMSEMLAES